MKEIASSAFADTKPHYNILDGLRGVASLMVIWFHVSEAFATSVFDLGINLNFTLNLFFCEIPVNINGLFNHGYLAVDFFFMLSGFVVGYAYDSRWKDKTLTTKDFFKRRFIRLHPMVILGAVLGAITFYIQGCSTWEGTQIATSMLMLATLCGMFLIPAAPGTGYDVRGHKEMFALNGPSWSLFFEYIGNILYALIIRRLPTKALAVLVALAGIGLACFAIFNFSNAGHLGVGWSLSMDGYNPPGGILRLLFSFSAGLLLSRIFKPANIKYAFWICSVAIVFLLAVPYVGGEKMVWANGIYDSVCVILIFPLLVWFGASGKTTNKKSIKICKFLGDISYPLYIVHYPFMYLFYAWVWGAGVFERDDKSKLTIAQTWHVALLVFLGSILLAYLILKLYDEPVRKFLTKRFLKK